MQLRGLEPRESRLLLVGIALAVVGLASVLAGSPPSEWFSSLGEEPKSPGPEVRRWTNSIGMEFVRIPRGTFTMGSASRGAAGHEKPAHEVTISRPFAMATTEVTQAQWQAVMGASARLQNGELPVGGVSWFDAMEFIRDLNRKEATTRYRLPTEAEWEFACRAGSAGAPTDDLESVAWYDPISRGTAHPVGRKRANQWGFHDMLGNVYEWCGDWKGPYPDAHLTDPSGPPVGTARVIRGGSWLVHANRAKYFFRDYLDPEYRRDDVGFRVVAEVETR